MRSKEVEKAIKIVLAVRGTYDSYNDMMFGTGYADKEVQSAIDKVIEYIEELEKENNKCEYYESVADALYKDSISKDKIRDKIKEYKNLLNTCNKKEDIERIKGLNERILVLEEIIGE